MNLGQSVTFQYHVIEKIKKSFERSYSTSQVATYFISNIPTDYLEVVCKTWFGLRACDLQLIFKLSIFINIETVQYKAALAIIKGISREKLYRELRLKYF